MAARSVYCICGEPYDSVRFMIQCDICKDWYHGSCVNVKEHEALDIEKYHCVQCQPVCGPSVYREIRNWHRHDYGDENADGKAVQSGTPVFVKELRSRHFPSCEDVLIRLRGPLLSLPYLMQNGFNFPILVDSKVGLGLQMPSDTFTVGDVMDYVGLNFSLDVIDVTRQENIRMTMQEWVEYFNSPVRNKVYNVISLEFSQTRLAELVKPPAIVQKLSWVENYWPKTVLPITFPHVCPQVMKYCLMSTQDSYTDFHIDFGGTSVWYHVLRGEKVFYLIRPTPANLALYEHWMASSNQSETFFGDQVDVCYQLVLTQGQTLFIPTGWIHAVFTPVDSLVFGGNFLHSLNIPLQLQIHEMERRISTPEKYKFPSFEAVHWFAAPHILEQLKDYNVSKRELQHLASGAKALVAILKSWSTDIQNHQQQSIPPGTNVSKLIKDLQREVRIAEKYANGKSSTITVPKKTPQRQRKPKEINIKFSPTKVSVEGEKNGSSALKFSIKPRVRVNSEASNQYNQMESNFTAADLEAMDTSLQLSKEYDDRLNASYNIAIPLVGNPSLKGGTISEGNGLFKSSPSRISSQDEFSPAVKKESVYDFVDSDEDNLVVDENPPNKRQKMADLRRQNRPQDLIDMKGSIKLRLSINNKPMEGESAIPNDVESQTSEDGSADVPKNATIDDLLVATGLAVDAENTSISLDDVELSGGRTSPSTREAIQGMLSISKSAFLFANQADSSGVCSPPPAPAPPPAPSRVTGTGAMDLSSSMPLPLMDSSLANFSILAKKSSPPIRTNHYPTKMTSRPARYNNEDDDFEESLKQCHQDGDFIYLGLEASDDECHVFKPRGRSKRDEPWNPKAKLIPNCPKPERPVREGVKKEAIECGLAAAAAKLANMPPPKRQYLKKKSPVTKSKEAAIEPLPGPSTSVQGVAVKRPLPDPVKSNKKPKKGFATAKQRLGKILKIHKMLY